MLAKEVDAASQDEQSDFEFKTFGRDGMNRFREQAFEQATRGFNELADRGLQIRHLRRHRSQRILLPQGQKFHTSFSHQILDGVIVVGFVPCDPGLFWYIEILEPPGTRVTKGSRRQKEFNGLALFGDHNMNTETLKIAFFAGNIASPVFASIDFRASDAIVVAHGDGITVNYID